MNLFTDEYERIAIDRIQRFARVAEMMGEEIHLGFSGGKDSQVVYDLCVRSGIPFRAFYNVSFESPTTKAFIREYYPEVIWRRSCKYGYIENIIKKHHGLLPTVQISYCCEDYKHPVGLLDRCSITGVRKAESRARSTRTTFSYRNKSVKKTFPGINDYFLESCQSVGSKSVISLLPIVDWSDREVWDYINRHGLPVNPEYKLNNRVGCIVCPKANFTRNFVYLMRYPKLVDAFISAQERFPSKSWLIHSDGVDYKDDKPYYICRWLNRSFLPFTKSQQVLYDKWREKYNQIKNDKNK